jgi:4-hydroxybenzoate polyprenyltransferase
MHAIYNILKAIRIHQWTKNFIVFIPLLASHKLTDPARLSESILAFVSFCFTASAAYIINDLHDLAADRQHPQKSKRPIASGKLSKAFAFGLLVLLLAGVLMINLLWTNVNFCFWLLCYFLLSNAYSFFFKKRLLADVFALASLYTIRIFAGGAAEGVAISQWLMMFSLFFFLSLAFTKRFTELYTQRSTDQQSLPGRGYLPPDFEILRVVGPANGYLAILVLALYVNSPDVQLLYKTPNLLWLLCPLLGYWITRIWFIANRGHLHHDPVAFALTDFKSYLTALCCAIVVIAASLKLWHP